ncbi:MAG TPA: hypothetical protein H9716_00010 [Candidatus Enterocloster faecavium]|uniref:Uncharacterized protein n=1 Tax=Candidatus Enterocloster faecavium TaxID=2838560 RepID=A0A9D2L5C3_9FIRM|nr:hypothetical protein [Candidatus Enterocloster faecavium]
MQEVKKDVRVLKGEMQEVKEDVRVLKGEMKEVKEDVRTLSGEVQSLKTRVIGIELHLENETDRGIKIIGEGHADLMRKLDEALRIENEKEMLHLRVNFLEGEVRNVKRRLSYVEKAKTA